MIGLSQKGVPKPYAAMLWLVLAVLVAATSVDAQPMGPGFLERLHDDLRLSPSQEQQWATFEQAYRVAPDEIARERDADTKMASLTGPQRVDLAITMAEDDLAGLRRRAAALKIFYATLSPEQQRMFDTDTMPPGPRGR